MTHEPGRRVVVVFHEPHLGGAIRSVTRIVPMLRERGWEFSFWVPRPSELFDELSGQGFDVSGAPREIQYSVRAWRTPPGPRKRATSIPPYLRRFRAFVRDRAPALVHANSILTIAEAMVARRQGPAVLLHAHEMLPGGLRGTLLRLAAWRLDQVVAVSRASASPLEWRGTAPRLVYDATPVPESPGKGYPSRFGLITMHSGSAAGISWWSVTMTSTPTFFACATDATAVVPTSTVIISDTPRAASLSIASI